MKKNQIHPEPCSEHKPKTGLTYVEWFDWAEEKGKTEKQKQCPKCKRWYFKEEM